MSLRLAGAAAALTAAALVAAAIISSALWAGPPSVDGRVIEKKTVYIGLLGAQGCNTGGDGRCEDLVLSDAFSVAGFVQLGTSALFILVTLGLAITAGTKKDLRKSLGKVALAVAGLCALVLVAMFVVGPGIKSTHEVVTPIGYGTFLFAGGLVAAVLAGLFAPKDDPPMQLRSRPSASALPPPPAQAPPLDVLALLQGDDALRPTAPPSPGGMLPGPAGPLGASSAAMPLFNAAPQLRALYDADPAQGGTHGFQPNAPAPLPQQGPTPIRRSQVSAIVGIPTPPVPFAAPIMSSRPETTQDPAPPPPPPVPPPPAAMRAKAASVVPPPRAKAPSVPPPNGPRKLQPGFSRSLSGPTKVSSAVPPPPASPMLPFRADTDPSELAATRQIDAEPDLMVGRPADGASHAVGDTTDANVVLPPPEDTDVSRAIEDAETVARTKQDPADLETQDGEPPTQWKPPSHKTPAPRSSKTPAPQVHAMQTAAPAVYVKGNTPAPTLTPAAEPAPSTRAIGSASKIPVTTAGALPPPKDEAVTAHASGPQPACPQCEAPMAWIEEHLRFYCKSCRMYF